MPFVGVTAPLPISAPPLPAVEIIVPPSISMLAVALPLPPPIPAELSPPCTVSAPVPVIVSVPRLVTPFFCRPTQLLPLLSVLVVPSARVIVTFPVLLSAIRNAATYQAVLILTPARVIFAFTPSATAIESPVASGLVFAIVTALSLKIVSVPSE